MVRMKVEKFTNTMTVIFPPQSQHSGLSGDMSITLQNIEHFVQILRLLLDSDANEGFLDERRAVERAGILESEVEELREIYDNAVRISSEKPFLGFFSIKQLVKALDLHPSREDMKVIRGIFDTHAETLTAAASASANKSRSHQNQMMNTNGMNTNGAASGSYHAPGSTNNDNMPGHHGNIHGNHGNMHGTQGQNTGDSNSSDVVVLAFPGFLNFINNARAWSADNRLEAVIVAY